VDDAVDLLDFVQNQMKMTYYYQPVVIKALVQNGGRAPKDLLAVELLLGDPDTLPNARKTLQRWPWKTLRDRGVVTRDSSTSDWILKAKYKSEDIPAIVAACDVALNSWAKRFPQKQSAQRIHLLELAGGCCQACGARPPTVVLDIDHIIPKSRARNGSVKLENGDLIHVDDERNLQVLCAPCNRGKRDQGDFDFRASESRLAESIATTLDIAASHGYNVDVIFKQGLSLHVSGLNRHLPAPATEIESLSAMQIGQ